jgi:hypothetical protein
MAIPKIYKNGVEITKPWSQEMYDHNAELKDYYEREITQIIESAKTMDELKKIASCIEYSSYVNYEMEEIREDLLNTLMYAELYIYKEMVTELSKEGFLEMVKDSDGEPMNIIGFESPAEIKELRKIYA